MGQTFPQQPQATQGARGYLRRPQNLEPVQHGYAVRIYTVVLDLAHVYVLECSALYGIYHYHLKSRVREKLKQDKVVVRRGFHDHDRPRSALRLNLMQLFLCEFHAGYVVVDFLPEQDVVLRA